MEPIRLLVFGAALKLIYLTGAPASGKSSTLKKLQEAEHSLFYFEYGAELTSYVKAKGAPIANQQELRAQSSDIVTPEHVDALDRMLLDKVRELRGKRPIVIDSHSVTKESYGYRITSFSEKQIKELNPDEIWFFYTAPQAALDRIEQSSAGRPMISAEEARMHTLTQASITSAYGIMANAPVYLFDTNRDQDELVRTLRERIVK